MALLLNTDIDKKVHKYIRGAVARIGGGVNQLVDYRNMNVTDINVPDGGFGYVKRISDIRSLRNFLGTIKRFVEQEYKYFKHGNKFVLDRKTIILDVHDAHTRLKLKHKFDACISSNVVEHAPNPIFFLLNCYFITKKDGYQFHAIPHYKYTYDMYRKPTAFDHFIEDFENRTGLDDRTHVEDYIQSAIIKHGWQRKFHAEYPVKYPFMHHHVYDEDIVYKLASYMFEEVTNDIYKTSENSDNIVIFKNRLNSNFIKKHGNLISMYSNNFLN
jgi:SAM-dependent methyltransferase